MKNLVHFLKKPAILYKRFLVWDTKRTLKGACVTLDKYAADVLNIQITEGSFPEVKYLYLAYVSNRFNIREMIYTALEAIITFVMVYVYILVEKEKIFLTALDMGNASFIALFFLAFYIPRRIKAWISTMTPKNKAIKDLTFLGYEKVKKMEAEEKKRKNEKRKRRS